jgi:hypothetical protein
MVLDIHQAYRVLELSPPITKSRLKSQYRTLAKRWHPDRFKAGSAAQADAATRMVEINEAFRTLAGSLAGHRDRPEEVHRPPSRAGTLSQQDIEEIIASINRSNAWRFLPEMNVNRWMSIVAFAGYVSAVSGSWSAAIAEPAVNRAMGRALAYFCLPLFVIWYADAQRTPRKAQMALRGVGWTLMAGPAILWLLAAF